MAGQKGNPGAIASTGLALMMLVAFASLSAYLTPSDSELISVFALGLGYGLGVTLTFPRSMRLWTILLYGSTITLVSLIGDRPLGVSLGSGLVTALILVGLILLGDRLKLYQLNTPVDVFRLILLAAVSGLLIPFGAVIGFALIGRLPELLPVLPQAVLTGIGGILLTGAMALAYEPGGFWISGARRQAELFALACITVFLMLGLTLTDATSIAGSAPLFLLVMAMGWLGLRFGPMLATTGLVCVATWIAFSVKWGVGTFADAAPTQNEAMLAAQIYTCVLATGIISLSVYARHTRQQDADRRRTSELLSSAADSAATQVFIKHYNPATDRFVYVEANANFAYDLGLQPGEVVGLSDEDLLSPSAAADFYAQDMDVMTSGERRRFESSFLLNGRQVTYLASKFPVHDRNGKVIGVGGVSLDRTEELRRTAMLQQVFTYSPVPTARLAWSGEGLGEVQEVNQAFASLVGLPAAQIVGEQLNDVLRSPDALRRPDGSATQRREVRVRRPDGAELAVVATSAVVDIHGDADRFALLILEDVTATRAAEAGLIHRATHDPLTDLLNRQALIERLAASATNGLVPEGTTVWCCDIDGFKQFNDSLGHDTGDRVLLAMGERLRTAVSAPDLVGRLGGDEFVVVSSSAIDADRAMAIGRRIREAVAHPLEMDGRTHSLRVSVGLAICTGDVGAEDLLRQADVALTRAKDLGRDRIEMYLPELDRRVQLRVAMRETLRKALAENRIEVHVQPLVNLADGRTVGAESLVRLRDLDGTILPPAAFIPVAEESGLIVPLGLRVLDLSLALCAQWAERGTPLEIAVNVSPRQLEHADFAATVQTLLQIHGVPPERLSLEVTESTVVDASGQTLAMLRDLHASGIHVAIDDFGTGYSSLASLRDLPADVVKIDRSFVSGLEEGGGDEAIVRAVLAMAHATGRVVVAEGVETAEQAAKLAHFNCDRVQGYLYSRPVPPFDFVPGRTYPVRQGKRVTRSTQQQS